MLMGRAYRSETRGSLAEAMVAYLRGSLDMAPRTAEEDPKNQSRAEESIIRAVISMLISVCLDLAVVLTKSRRI